MLRPAVLAAALAVLVGVSGCVASEPVAAPPPAPAAPGSRAENAQAMARLVRLLDRCRTSDCGLAVGRGVEVDTVAVEGGVVVARFSRDLGDGPVRPAGVASFERQVGAALAPVYGGLPVRVETRGDALAALVPNAQRAPAARDAARRFAPPVTGPPLVRPADAGRRPPAGLAGRHVALWPSHGWIWTPDGWGWQRPRLFTSVEDLLTVGFVTRELTPMLERAGAVVLLARERDVNAREAVVDDGADGYRETGAWADGTAGFALRDAYGDGENPFGLGATRETAAGTAVWTPDLPAPGAYAVHASYAAGPDRTDAARYTVRHAGGASEVVVNQRIGGGTWVYLGTWEFEAGRSGSVTLAATGGGTVSADAVRWGGGEGVIARGGPAAPAASASSPRTATPAGTVSGRPRWTEASRYYQQWAGVPPEIYNVTGEAAEDYTDDFRSRGEWVGWLRGAPFGPTESPDAPGLGVPVDAALAWHTDAGVVRDGLVGTLAIYNVPGMDSTRTFPDGTSRLANRDLADGVQTALVDDLRRLWAPDWPRRSMWDRAYSEATRPQVPALLLELLSHQNFRDMRFALDPRFQFDAARAVYKGLGRFLAEGRGTPFVPQPLRPTHVAAVLDRGEVVLSWRPQPDPLEPDAEATGYRVYTRDGRWGWDDGTSVTETTARLPAPPVGTVRSYRVAAVNGGGESRPSAALAVGVAERGAPPVLVVDGFDRVAGPDAVDRPGYAGFVDLGVPEGLGVVTVGRQVNFDPSDEYATDAAPGWGASGADLEATPVLGNTRDWAAAHGQAWLAAGRSFVSASAEAVEVGTVDLARYPVVDLALGLERRTAWPDPADPRPPAFEALPGALRQRVGAYLDGGGALVVSGAHWATDAGTDPASAVWLRTALGVEPGRPVDDPSGAVATDAGPVVFTTAPGPDALAVRRPDALAPTGTGRVVARYAGAERGAAVAAGRAVSFGFPLAAVADEAERAALVRLALAALGR